MLADKDPLAVVEALRQIKHWHFAGLNGYRGQTSQQLAAKVALPTNQFEMHSCVEHAIQNILQSERFEQGKITAPIFVIGSFLTVAAAEQALKTIEGLSVNGN